MKIIWSEDAEAGLNSIFRYRERSTARRFIYKILKEVNILSKFPKGAPVLIRTHIKEYRSLTVADGNYKVIYFIEEVKECIVLVDIWDCRQNPENLALK